MLTIICALILFLAAIALASDSSKPGTPVGLTDTAQRYVAAFGLVGLQILWALRHRPAGMFAA